jgi:hypothetical protein
MGGNYRRGEKNQRISLLADEWSISSRAFPLILDFVKNKMEKSCN